MNIVESLARRYIKADVDLETLNSLWSKVEPFLGYLTRVTAVIAASLRDPTSTSVVLQESPHVFVANYRSTPQPIFKLATGALQNFALTAPERKAANWLAQKVTKNFRIFWSPFRPIGKEEALKQTKILFEFRDCLNLLRAVYKKYETNGGEDPSAGSNTVKAGSFTLVNAGGFKPEIMESTKDLMVKAESLLRGSGLGQVCYGKVTLTQSIGSSNNVLAFYEKSSDSLYVRAVVRATNKTLLATVLHELGHRYDFQFLKNDNGKKRLYYRMEGKKPALKPPAIGDTVLLTRGNIATVTGIQGTTVLFTDSKGKSGKCSFEAWWSNLPEQKLMLHPTLEGFVSTYAGKSPDENFAEMFSYYVMGDLPVNQAVLFENLVFGKADFTVV